MTQAASGHEAQLLELRDGMAPAMAAATAEMQCEVVGCHFKTPPMEPTMAMQRLELDQIS